MVKHAHRLLISLGVTAVAVGSLSSFSGATPVKAASSTCPDTTSICFGTPNVMDPMESVGEPTIVHSPASDNTVYASGPWGTGTQRSIWNASADLGETFRLVQQCPPTSGLISVPGACPPPDAVTGTANPPGGGDTDQRLDHTGKDYFADLWALACDRVAETPDRGATANQFLYGCNSPTTTTHGRPEGSDRQWLAEFDPHLSNPVADCTGAPDCTAALATPITYMEYNNLQTTQNGCSYWVRSTDGLHYSPANNDHGNYGCDGYPSVDQVTGKVFEASGQGTDATGTHGCSANTLCLNIGTPVDSAGDLCFLDDNGSTTIGGTTGTMVNCPNGGGLITIKTGLVGDPALLFTVSSMDTGRNLHVTYAVNGSVSSTDGGITGTSTYQVFTTVASAATGWTKWATPVQVSQSPSNVNVFPWVVAGGPGRSDSVWYGTNSFIDPSTGGSQAWNVYMNQVVWPVNSDGTVQADGSGVPLPPVSTGLVKVSPHPNHYDTICLQGTGCVLSTGDRNLADFFTVTIDHNGAAEVMYDDTSNGLEQPLFNPLQSGCAQLPCAADHPGAPVVTIARQDQGPGLFGTDVSLRPHEPDEAPNVGQFDASGDALYPVIGGANVPSLDFVNDSTTQMANQLNLSGGNLTVTMKLGDLSSNTTTGIPHAFTTVPGTQFLQYVTRWVMCGTYPGGPGGNCKIYYAEAECQTVAGCSAGTYTFWAGRANSLDLCSVSACNPHVEVYPDAPVDANGNTAAASMVNTGSSVDQTTGVVSIQVPVGDIGSPAPTTLLEEVGSYAFASAQAQSQLTNPNAELDQLPLTVDGICCFNFQNNEFPASVPEAPWTPGLIGLGVALILGGSLRRRRRQLAA